MNLFLPSAPRHVKIELNAAEVPGARADSAVLVSKLRFRLRLSCFRAMAGSSDEELLQPPLDEEGGPAAALVEVEAAGSGQARPIAGYSLCCEVCENKCQRKGSAFLASILQVNSQ